jgi:hypothetical protein
LRFKGFLLSLTLHAGFAASIRRSCRKGDSSGTARDSPQANKTEAKVSPFSDSLLDSNR